MKLRLCAVVGILLWAALCRAWAADVLIENVSIVSPERNAAATSQHVLIRNGRIAQISSTPIETPSNTFRLNGRGKYLTPGLMDSHVHLAEAPGVPRGVPDPELQRLQTVFLQQQPRSYLYFGVTQVVDLIRFPTAIETFTAQPQHPDVFHCGAAPALNGYPTVFLDPPARYELFPDYIYEPANAKDHPLPAGADAAAHTARAVVDRIERWSPL